MEEDEGIVLGQLMRFRRRERLELLAWAKAVLSSESAVAKPCMTLIPIDQNITYTINSMYFHRHTIVAFELLLEAL